MAQGDRSTEAERRRARERAAQNPGSAPARNSRGGNSGSSRGTRTAEANANSPLARAASSPYRGTPNTGVQRRAGGTNTAAARGGAGGPSTGGGETVTRRTSSNRGGGGGASTPAARGAAGGPSRRAQASPKGTTKVAGTRPTRNPHSDGNAGVRRVAGSGGAARKGGGAPASSTRPRARSGSAPASSTRPRSRPTQASQRTGSAPRGASTAAGGGNYDSMSFAQAFAAARRNGASTFNWKGGRYTTKMQGE